MFIIPGMGVLQLTKTLRDVIGNSRILLRAHFDEKGKYPFKAKTLYTERIKGFRFR